MSVPVPVKEPSPNAPLMILTVVVPPAPPLPVKVGSVVLNTKVETFAPAVLPKLVPRNKTTAPWVRAKLVKVIMVDPPAAGVMVTVLSPVLKVKAPAVSEAAALKLPIKLKLPPFIVRAVASPKRLATLVLVLSKLL